MKSVMQHQFSNVPRADIQRSSFNRNHGYKTTFDSGYLIPIFADEALPGDTLNLRMTGFARLATPLKPIMDNMFMETQFFSVPLRLIWDNFQRFMGEQPNPGDSTDFLVPQFTPYIPSTGSISDYIGIPLSPNAITHSSLFHRAINLIRNEWYRDENLQNASIVDKGDGPDNIANYPLFRRGKRHDYFTSCLPWPQKGDPVSTPLGTTAPIIAEPHPTIPGNSQPIIFTEYSGETSQFNMSAAAGAGSAITRTQAGTAGTIVYGGAGLLADLSSATAATINQLREAFQMQRLFERDARGGTRYTEIIRSHFGVVSPDQRLQRPEFLGGGSTRINLTPVANTNLALGNLGAYGTAGLKGHGFTKSFTEHCIVIGFVSVRADLTYQQGMNRMFSRRTRYDYYWPALAHLGEQAVLNKEIFMDGTATDDEIFGYQERWAEYRYKPSLITGKYRSDAVGSLDVWHLSQDFASVPILGDTFIQENPPVSRVVQVPTEPQFMFDSYFEYRCARPMPMYSVPGMIDHL